MTNIYVYNAGQDEFFPYQNVGTSNNITSTSTSTLTILIGTEAFFTQTGLAFKIGQEIQVSHSATQYMLGTILIYNSMNGLMEVNFTTNVGTGNFNSWSISSYPLVAPSCGINMYVYNAGQDTFFSYDSDLCYNITNCPIWNLDTFTWNTEIRLWNC